MRKLLTVVALVTVAAVAFELLPRRAEAGPVIAAQLSSADAGCTQTVQLAPRISYCVQAKYSETCIAFGAWDGGTGVLPDAGISGLSGDCTRDFIIGQEAVIGQTRTYPYFCFDSADNTAMVACNLDGGASNVNLFKLKKNVSNPYGPTTPGK